jgi:putative NIF3 family GTP cyclohydrolase 1 type 2
MQLFEITKYLEQLAPLAYAEDFDNVGLLTSHTNDIMLWKK